MNPTKKLLSGGNQCPKCQSTANKITFHPAPSQAIGCCADAGRTVAEHMRLTCRVCGAAWLMLPLDADEQKPEEKGPVLQSEGWSIFNDGAGHTEFTVHGYMNPEEYKKWFASAVKEVVIKLR